MSRRVGLTTRVFAVIATIVLVVIGAASALSMASLRRVSETAAQRGLEQSADLAAQFLAGRTRSLAGGARVFVQNPYFRTLVSQRRRDDVLDQAFEAAEQLDADWVFITDERGTLIAKSDEPAAGDIPMGDVPLVASALRGQTTSGFGASGDSALFQAVGVPIGVVGSAPVGVLVATKLIGGTVARDMRATTGSELVFYTRDRASRRHVAVSTVEAAAHLDDLVEDVADGPVMPDAGGRSVRVGRGTYLAQGASLTTAGGEPVGGFVLLRARDSELTGIAGVRRSLLLASALGLVLALVAAFLAARYVARPVHALASAVRRAADGDYERGVTGSRPGRALADAGPELDSLADAVDHLLTDLRGKEALMQVAPAFAPVTATPDDVRHDARGPHALSPRRGSPLDRVSRAQPGSGAVPRLRAIERSDIGLEIASILAGRYEIEALVGSGGLGVVYRARDVVVGETVALKMLRPELVLTRGDAMEHLRHELRVTRRISHRNVVRTHDIGESNGVPFLTMEYVDGASLSSIVQAHGALPLPAVRSIALQLLRALAVTAEQGIVHGDLKPANVLIGPGGVLKVTDFGVARVVRQARAPGAPQRLPHDAALLHPGGAVVGTPEYMAPEQLLGEAPTAASDIYAAGILLQECLVGTIPQRADTPIAFLSNKLQPSVLPAARVRLLLEASYGDSAVHRIVATMLDPDLTTRPSSAAALYESFAALS